ncbi:MAG: PEP/pyruvate-binding domain-containing protein, partial [Planctomycetota bacterium]
MSQEQRSVFFFQPEGTDGDATQRDLLGGKGANLAEMCRLGLPVPPGFTIATSVCAHYRDHGAIPEDVLEQVDGALTRLEEAMGRRFGDTDAPLFVSVRSGAAVSMPGMMDTVLNLGLNGGTVEALARTSRGRRFALDAYRRLINMFGDVVMGVDH